VRILIGEALKIRRRNDNNVAVLETNLDDVSGEQIGFAIDQLWKAGALDVFTSPVQMKKDRPGVLLTVLAQPADRTKLEQILFQETGTLGIRYREQERAVARRASVRVETEFGSLRGKVSYLPDGHADFSPEYDDCKAIAERHQIRLAMVVEAAKAAYARADSPLVDSTDQTSAPTSYREPEKARFDHSHDHGHDHGHTHDHENENVQPELRLNQIDRNGALDQNGFQARDAQTELQYLLDRSENDQPPNEDEDFHRHIPRSYSYHSPSHLPRPHFLDTQDDEGGKGRRKE
jgi:hypothetical protein